MRRIIFIISVGLTACGAGAVDSTSGTIGGTTGAITTNGGTSGGGTTGVHEQQPTTSTSGSSGSSGTSGNDCSGVDLSTDINNCGACGNSCTAWMNTHVISGGGLGAMCVAGECVVAVQLDSQMSCTAICQAQQLACIPQDSCMTPDGPTNESFGGCAAYQNPQGSICLEHAPLGCDDVPANTETCHSDAHGDQTGTFNGGECLCG